MPYVKPGVYIQQKYLVSGATRGGFVVPTIIGPGLKEKRIWNEPVTRGLVTENVTIDPDTREFVLSYNSDGKYQYARLYRDGNDIGNNSFVFDSNEPSKVQIKAEYWSPDSTYRFSYIAVGKSDDSVEYPVEGTVFFVSSAPNGTRQYQRDVDYQITNGKIDWSIIKQATIESQEGPFDLTINNRIKIGLDGKVPIEIIVVGANQSSVTVEEIRDIINATLQNSQTYGQTYANTASVQDGKIVLTSALYGASGKIIFYTPSTSDATSTIFGVTAPFITKGTGSAPSIGTVYYVSYNTTRTPEEYDTLKLYYSYSDALEDLGPMNDRNSLLIGIELAFLNGAQVVGAVQIKDFNNDGMYLDTDWYRAIDVIKANNIITEVCVLTTDTDVENYLLNTIEQEASITKNNWMGGYFGVPKDMLIGDIDAPGSIVHKAAKQLQVPAQSQGRGRFILVSTPDVGGLRRTIVDTDTRISIDLELDTTYAACALMGLVASLEPISDTLLRKQIVGFDASKVSVNEVSASFLASNGVFVLINKGGRLVCFDPVTTDTGGDPIFSEPNVRLQKDYLAARIRNRLDEYIVGAMVDDLDDFG